MQPWRWVAVTVGLVAAIGLLAGCGVPKGTVYEKDGKSYGVTKGAFRSRWWNFYERALSYASGGYYEDALRDLDIAIRLRPDDKRGARTYGLHFTDYFPHREKGIILLRQGDASGAIAELERSLSSADSAKAKYYLNKARALGLKETGADRRPPTIVLDEEAFSAVTNAFSVMVRGEARDDSYVSEVVINDEPELIELAAPVVTFEREVSLSPGQNTITVAVEDLAGRTTSREVALKVDRQGPLLNLERSERLEGAAGLEAVVQGVLFDLTGVAEYTFGDLTIQAHGDREIAFSHRIPLPPGARQVEFSASDLAGNVSRAAIDLGEGPSNQPTWWKPAPFQIVPARWDFSFSRPFGSPSLLLEPAILVSQADWMGQRGLHTGRGRRPLLLAESRDDADPPFIKLKGLRDGQEVYFDSLYVEGEVLDDSTITSLKVNREPLSTTRGRRLFFNYLLALEEGRNLLTIAATDEYGNTAQETLTIVRKVNSVNQVGSRMSLSVIALEQKGEEGFLGEVAYDDLIAALVEQGRFRVVEREELEQVLREQQLSQTELVDAETAARVGQIIAADAVLVGAVVESEESIEVLARMVDTETTAVLSVQDVYDEDKSLRKVRLLMRGLALKFKQAFPLVDGYVIKTEGGEIVTDLGKEKRLREGMKIIIYRTGEEIVHPVTKEVLEVETEELGLAKVTKVSAKLSRADLLSVESEGVVQVADRVITK